MNVYLGVGFDLVKWHLEGMYGTVEEGRDGDGNRVLRVRVFSSLRIKYWLAKGRFNLHIYFIL